MDSKPRGRRGYGRATLQDVARRAGVSAITVSRVLRSPEMVADGTRERVRAAIHDLGYIPNYLAGSLASTRSHTVAAIIPTLANSIFTEVLHGMVSVLRPAGYQLLVGNSAYDPKEEESVLLTFLARQVDAVMLTGANHTRRMRTALRDQPTPVVETWSLPKRPIGDVVGFSNAAAAHAMVDHLVRRGYRRIGFASAPVASNDRAAARRQGFLAGLKHHGLEPLLEAVVETDFGLAHGGRALHDMLAARPDLDAAFFANDTLATGALLACHREGRSVPGDVAIAGFDDLEIAREIVPPLTTVRIPRYRLGRATSELLLARLHDADRPRESIDVGFEIVERGST